MLFVGNGLIIRLFIDALSYTTDDTVICILNYVDLLSFLYVEGVTNTKWESLLLVRLTVHMLVLQN